MNICASLGELRERLVAGTKPELRLSEGPGFSSGTPGRDRRSTNRRTWTDSDTRQVFVGPQALEGERVMSLNQFRDLVRLHAVP